MNITAFGTDAYALAQMTSRLPEIFDTTINTWRPARSMGEARQLVDAEAQRVRLRGDVRGILQDHLHTGYPLTADVGLIVAQLQDSDTMKAILQRLL